MSRIQRDTQKNKKHHAVEQPAESYTEESDEWREEKIREIESEKKAKDVFFLHCGRFEKDNGAAQTHRKGKEAPHG